MKIGVIGGGQLGRMLALAGTPLGMNFAFLDPAPDACAAALGEHLRADYGDLDHLRQLADEVDLVTFEFESVPAETVAFLSQFVPVYPSADALRIARCPGPLVRKEHVQGPGHPDAGVCRHPVPS
ncbi:MAG: phosphoribosylaminoimidazole carboxylase ATPase subunit [Pseudomonas sp.]|nr:phosphoribosylaminoimidazole carboxylase ATPase subunit [Pseudomonas sp.]